MCPRARFNSSVLKRSWKQGGQARHHLIDPRTRQPAATDWLSVTVIAPHATLAETFAKALLIAGSTGAAASPANVPISRFLLSRLMDNWWVHPMPTNFSNQTEHCRSQRNWNIK